MQSPIAWERIMKSIGTARILAAFSVSVALSSAAFALPVAQFHDVNADASGAISRINLFSGQEVTFGLTRLDRLNAQTVVATENYYDFDTIITLGALVIAGGALAA